VEIANDRRFRITARLAIRALGAVHHTSYAKEIEVALGQVAVQSLKPLGRVPRFDRLWMTADFPRGEGDSIGGCLLKALVWIDGQGA
jgi:hypothetical protein